MKSLPCFISHFMQQRVYLILKQTKDEQWRRLYFKHTVTITEYKSGADKCTCGVVSVVVLLMVSSIWAVWTSRVSNWCSNLSMRPEIWKKKWLRHCFITCYQMIWYNFMCKWHSCLFQIHTLQSGIHAFHHSSHRFCDLRDKTPWLIWKPKWQETSCNWFFFFLACCSMQ